MQNLISLIFRRPPDFIIGSVLNPYLRRWHIIPRNRFLNIYLHNILRDDDDRALHDHPWFFISFMLKGRYIEIMPKGKNIRCAPSVAYRRATQLHRIVLYTEQRRMGLATLIASAPVWTLVITGPRVREWGFSCPRGWVHWKEFTSAHNKGEVGKGCEQ